MDGEALPVREDVIENFITWSNSAETELPLPPKEESPLLAVFSIPL